MSKEGNKFKIGDTVKCVDPGPGNRWITKGKIYTVLNDYSYYSDQILIIADNGEHHDYYYWRFELANNFNVKINLI